MRYLWRQPLLMPNDRLVGLLGEEPHTPIDEAVAETLTALGCLPQRAAQIETAEALVPANMAVSS
ncbi:hypothetical protein D3C87_1886720 [compost metagenome]